MLGEGLENREGFLNLVHSKLQSIARTHGYLLQESPLGVHYPGEPGLRELIGWGTIGLFGPLGLNAVLNALIGYTVISYRSFWKRQPNQCRDYGGSHCVSLSGRVRLQFDIAPEGAPDETFEVNCSLYIDRAQPFSNYMYRASYRVAACKRNDVGEVFPHFNNIVTTGNFIFDAREFLEQGLLPYVDAIREEARLIAEEANELQGARKTRRAAGMRRRAHRKRELADHLEQAAGHLRIGQPLFQVSP